MQLQESLDGRDVSAVPGIPTKVIRVVIAYNDIIAGTRAMGMLNKLAERLGDEIQFVPIPWKFNLLDDTDWRAVAATDAVKADILILAVSSGATMPSFVERWTQDVLEGNRRKTAAVVAMFDAESMSPEEASSRLEAIKEWVRKAGLSFYSPSDHGGLGETVEHLDERAEKVTPLLEHILEDHGPTSRTGY